MSKRNVPSSTTKHGLVTPKASMDSISSEDANDNPVPRTTSQNAFGLQEPLHQEPVEMDRPPSELPTKQTKNPAVKEPVRAVTDPVAGKSSQQDDSTASTPNRSQSQTLAQGRVLVTNAPVQNRGHRYIGKTIIRGNASVIKGSIYDTDDPPSWMACHDYIGDTIIEGEGVNFQQGDRHGPSLEKGQFWHRRG